MSGGLPLIEIAVNDHLAIHAASSDGRAGINAI